MVATAPHGVHTVPSGKRADPFDAGTVAASLSSSPRCWVIHPSTRRPGGRFEANDLFVVPITLGVAW